MCLRQEADAGVTEAHPCLLFDSLSAGRLAAPCHLLAAAAVVNVDLEPRRLLRVLPVAARRPRARQCTAITTRAQSAGEQQPSKQSRRTARGMCCALDMVWTQALRRFSHLSDSWDYFRTFFCSGRRRSVCACAGAPVHARTLWTLVTQQVTQTDTADGCESVFIQIKQGEDLPAHLLSARVVVSGLLSDFSRRSAEVFVLASKSKVLQLEIWD